MILPFSTQLNGNPSYFVEKIWEGLLRTVFKEDKEYIAHLNAHEEQFGKHWDFLPDEADRMTNPKLHTIREDKNDRWKPGTKIDFFINFRQKNMFRFAPVLPVVSVQKVEIIVDKFEFMNDYQIKVDGKLLTIDEKVQLALYDGFENLLHFFMYFNEDFTGKLIHWTDLKY